MNTYEYKFIKFIDSRSHVMCMVQRYLIWKNSLQTNKKNTVTCITKTLSFLNQFAQNIYKDNAIFRYWLVHS